MKTSTMKQNGIKFWDGTRWILGLALLLFFSTNVYATGYIANSATIKSVQNVLQNNADIIASMSILPDDGGTLSCPTAQRDVLCKKSLSAGSDASICERFFRIAMMAFLSGKKVALYNYQATSNCGEATYISIFNP